MKEWVKKLLDYICIGLAAAIGGAAGILLMGMMLG